MSRFFVDGLGPIGGPGCGLFAPGGIDGQLGKRVGAEFELGILSQNFEDAPGRAEIDADFASGKLKGGGRKGGIPHVVLPDEDGVIRQGVLGGFTSGGDQIDVVLEHEGGQDILPVVDIISGAKCGAGLKNLGPGGTRAVGSIAFGHGLGDDTQIIPGLRDGKTGRFEEVVVDKHGQAVIHERDGGIIGADFEVGTGGGIKSRIKALGSKDRDGNRGKIRTKHGHPGIVQAENVRAFGLAQGSLKTFAVLTGRLLDVGDFDAGMIFLIIVDKRLDHGFRFPQTPPGEIG